MILSSNDVSAIKEEEEEEGAAGKKLEGFFGRILLKCTQKSQYFLPANFWAEFKNICARQEPGGLLGNLSKSEKESRRQGRFRKVYVNVLYTRLWSTRLKWNSNVWPPSIFFFNYVKEACSSCHGVLSYSSTNQTTVLKLKGYKFQSPEGLNVHWCVPVMLWMRFSAE